MRAKRILAWVLFSILIVGAIALGIRSYRALQGPPLQPWHTFVPAELHAAELDAADWTRYVAQEQAIFDSVRANVTPSCWSCRRIPRR